jgi:hypothetical protein
MSWVVIVWCVVILVWAIGGGASSANDCSHQTGSAFLSAQGAKNACDAGTGLGVAVILLIGFFGFVFLSLIWFMTRPKGRECPVCGENVKRGTTVCRACGHDFRAAMQPTGATP